MLPYCGRVLSTSLSGLSIQPTSPMKKSGKVSLVSANVACCSATFILVYDTHTPHTHHTLTQVERVSDKQKRFLHKSGIHIDQVCLYKPEDSSTLYQEMLTYKASQVSFHLISPHELHSDGSNWEYLEATFVTGVSSLHQLHCIIHVRTAAHQAMSKSCSL